LKRDLAQLDEYEQLALDANPGLLSAGFLGLASGLFVETRSAQKEEEEAIESVIEERRRNAFSTVPTANATVTLLTGKFI